MMAMIGLRELALVAMVVLALYGRSGVLKSRQFQTIWPWISPARRPSARGARAGEAKPVSRRSSLFQLEGNRLFWLLTILAATAVAAWVATRVIIAGRE